MVEISVQVVVDGEFRIFRLDCEEVWSVWVGDSQVYEKLDNPSQIRLKNGGIFNDEGDRRE